MPTGFNAVSPPMPREIRNTGLRRRTRWLAELPERQVAGILNGIDTKDGIPPATAPCGRFFGRNLAPGRHKARLQERMGLKRQPAQLS